MIWTVITIHILISIGLLWASWQAWQLRLVLSAVATTVNGYAKACQDGLSIAPPAILIAQKAAATTRVQYRDLLPQIQRIQMVLSIVNRLQTLVRSQKNFIKVKRSDRYGKRRR